MRRILSFLALICASSLVHAQQGSASLNDTTMIKRQEVSLTAPPVTAKSWNQITTKVFTMNIGAAILLDHNIVTQDNYSISQVGKVNPGTEFRGDRLILTGQLLFFKRPWLYMIGANYNGLDAPQGNTTYSFMDWNIEIPVGKAGGWITVGKMKEGVGYEYVAPGSQLFFTERGSGEPSLVHQRNIGIRYSNSIADQRLIYTIGLFNNYWETGKSFSDNGSQITARVIYLAGYKSDRNLLHVGSGYRYSGATNGELSFKGKPEANTAPYYFSTGNFTSSHSNTLMLELVKVNGPVSLVGEYVNNFVKTPVNNLSFGYYQLGGSWFLTGENRKYNRHTGTLGKLIPKKNFTFGVDQGPGAFELVARYTYSDFSDQTISGGTFGRFTSGLSWYPNTHFRFEINYGYGGLTNSGVTGNSNFWQFRAQFEL